MEIHCCIIELSGKPIGSTYSTEAEDALETSLKFTASLKSTKHFASKKQQVSHTHVLRNMYSIDNMIWISLDQQSAAMMAKKKKFHQLQTSPVEIACPKLAPSAMSRTVYYNYADHFFCEVSVKFFFYF